MKVAFGKRGKNRELDVYVRAAQGRYAYGASRPGVCDRVAQGCSGSGFRPLLHWNVTVPLAGNAVLGGNESQCERESTFVVEGIRFGSRLCLDEGVANVFRATIVAHPEGRTSPMVAS